MNEKDKLNLEDLLRKPSSSYFHPGYGWVAAEDVIASNTGASLKNIVEKLGVTFDFDAIDALILKYSGLKSVRHGRTQHKKTHAQWHIVVSEDKPLISFECKKGKWFDGCWSNQVPYWLLDAILRAILRNKPLGDQKADELIKKVRTLDVEHELVHCTVNDLHLSVVPTRWRR
jgi:hypothetical protein